MKIDNTIAAVVTGGASGLGRASAQGQIIDDDSKLSALPSRSLISMIR